MAQAAVPRYVTDASGSFSDCPPGHRFNLYFEIWEERWTLGKKADALRKTLSCNSVAGLLEGLRKRQQALANALPENCLHVFDARATAPFATGLGLEHPVENGFAFLSPYGLPYLAGSGVKGVLRKAAEELRDDGDTDISQPVIDALFGKEDANSARRGALSCWDVFPRPPKDEMSIEIMTPHLGHYYQGGSSPHEAGKPNPIPFLAVPAGSAFRFVVTCEPALLGDAVDLNVWKDLLDRITRHAFDWLGFGAKTAVGYGAMEDDPRAREERDRIQREAQEKLQREQKEQERLRTLELMTPLERSIREFLDARTDKNQPEVSALMQGLKTSRWSGDEKREVARQVRAIMQAAKKWKEKSEKKNPDKDRDFQDSLQVRRWIDGN